MDVQIVGRIIPISLTLQGAASVNTGATSNYTATASYDDGSSQNVNASFSLSPTNAATISSAGALSAAQVTANQTVTVSASYTQGDITVNASMQVTINIQGILGLSRGFNSFGELASEQTVIGLQNVYSYALTRDQSGSITTKTETIGGIPTQYAYGYDSFGRLTSVTLNGQAVEQYQYGANGTRTYEQNALRGISALTFSYSQEDNLLTAGNTAYQYDVDGFLITKTSGSQVTNYTYSTLGELLSVALPNGTLIQYHYDPLGRRIAKQVNGTIVEKYLWRGKTTLLATYDGNDNLLMLFQYADARMPLAMSKNGTNYYLCYDQVGSLRIVSDTSGNVVKELDYDSFGNVIYDSNPTFTVPFAFAGGQYDPDTGLVHFGARDYDPGTGMWTAKDPILFKGGDTNLYGYVLNNPVNLVDPFGLRYAEQFAGYGGIIGGTVVAAGSVVADVGTFGGNIAATPAEIGAGIGIGSIVGYGVGTIIDSAMQMGKGERGWEKGRGDDPFWDKSIDELKEIEKSSPDPGVRDRARKIRKMKEKTKRKPCN